MRLSPPPVRDGRALRGERNREQIVDAILGLIREGAATPTAEQVAQRAKVGTRTVFRHFDDMEGLYAAVSERLAAEVAPQFEAARFEGTLEARVHELVRCRARVFEHIAPMRRRSTPQEERSAVVQQARAQLDATLRDQLLDALAEDLERRSADVLESLDVLLSWEAWNRLRTSQRLGRERAARVLERAALAVLAPKERSDP